MFTSAKSNGKVIIKSAFSKMGDFLFWIICFVAALTALAGIIAPMITFLNTASIGC